MNSYNVLNARAVDAPREVAIPKSALTEIRMVDNPIKQTDNKGNKVKARFFTAKFWGYLAPLAARLAKGDVIALTGELGIETYKDKNGEERDKDIVRVNNFAVSKSETFFQNQGQGEAAPNMPETPAPGELPF
jgi:single-stranded DNA-binding protein